MVAVEVRVDGDTFEFAPVIIPALILGWTVLWVACDVVGWGIGGKTDGIAAREAIVSELPEFIGTIRIEPSGIETYCRPLDGCRLCIMDSVCLVSLQFNP